MAVVKIKLIRLGHVPGARDRAMSKRDLVPLLTDFTVIANHTGL